MATGTTNPPGSDHPLDLRADAKNLDLLLLGPNNSYPSRLGVEKRSWEGINSAYDAAEDDRYAQFQAQLATMGYELPSLPYAAGLTIIRETQLIERMGEFYRAKAGVVPFVTTGVWATDELNLVAVGDAVLRQELAGDTGAEIVNLDGRSVADTLRDTVNVNDGKFGAIGSTGTPVYHPLSDRYATLAEAQAFYPFVTSLAQSIDWAALNKAALYLEGRGGVIHGPSQFYVLTDELLLPDSVTFEGQGVGFWDTVYPNRPKTWGGTNLMPYGTGAKNFARRGITSMSTAGGARTIAVVGTVHLSTLMNADATGATPATPKQLSTVVRGKERLSKHWGLRNCRIVPWIGADGISEYSNQAYTGLAADWDVGVCMDDAEKVTLDNVQVVGYYRHKGVMETNSDYDTFGAQERNEILGCKIQSGLTARSGDVRKVEALSSSTVEILWDAESFWEPNGVFTGFPAPVFQQYSYTTLTRNGANLVFNGVSPDPTIVGLTQLRSPRRGSGAAGCIIRDTFVSGLDHTNGGKAEDYGLAPSCAFEASGYPLRGMAFDNFKIQSRETGLYFFHDCQDFFFDKCQAEGSGYRIASPLTSVSTAPAPSGDTRNLRLHSTYGFESSYVDFTPRSRTNDTESINSTGLNAGLDIRSPDTNPLTFSSYTNGEAFRLSDAGLLGIGTTSPAQKLHVAVSTSVVARMERTASGSIDTQYKGSLGTLSLRVNPTAADTGSFSGSGAGTITLGTLAFQWSELFAVKGTFSGPVRPGQYTLATLPSAAAFSTYEIDVTDATGGPKRCRSNGSVWQILNTTTTVS